MEPSLNPVRGRKRINAKPTGKIQFCVCQSETKINVNVNVFQRKLAEFGSAFQLSILD